jgi:amidase
MGYLGWIGTFEGKKGTGKEKVYESEMVRELRNLGAVLYCKTSVPHTLMMGETINNIIYYTFNPKNRNLSSGGSSGGEGALIGLKGSPIGFGTDIGGSIRIPAGFNGLYGIRPSHGRMPYEGMANSMVSVHRQPQSYSLHIFSCSYTMLKSDIQDGQNSMLSVVGPIATSVGALRLMMKSILSQEPWLHDPLVAEIPWRDAQEQAVFDLVNSSGAGQLSFGVMYLDGDIHPQPPVRRAIEIVVKTVEKLGHKVIEWKPPSHQRGTELAVRSPPSHKLEKYSNIPLAQDMALRRGQRCPRRLRPHRRTHLRTHHQNLRPKAHYRVHRNPNRRDERCQAPIPERIHRVLEQHCSPDRHRPTRRRSYHAIGSICRYSARHV